MPVPLILHRRPQKKAQDTPATFTEAAHVCSSGRATKSVEQPASGTAGLTASPFFARTTNIISNAASLDVEPPLRAQSAPNGLTARPQWTPPAAEPGRPGDEPPVLCPAIKYVYDLQHAQWMEHDTMVRVFHPNRGIDQGAMRVCFCGEEVDEGGFASPMVAKMFRRNITDVVEKDYFNEGEAQPLCEEFATWFNRAAVVGLEKPTISFLQCHVMRIRERDIPDVYRTKRTGFFSYKTQDTRELMFVMEPRLRGQFTKYTSNFGEVYLFNETRLTSQENERRRNILETVEAFSHFTLVESGGSMLVCDLQGVKDFLTDPQIHTEDGKGLGMGNMGQEGIDKWVEKHRCNKICKAMQLQPLSTEGNTFSTGDVSSNHFYSLVRRMPSRFSVRPEDVIPPPKPLKEMTEDERLEYALQLSQVF